MPATAMAFFTGRSSTDSMTARAKPKDTRKASVPARRNLPLKVAARPETSDLRGPDEEEEGDHPYAEEADRGRGGLDQTQNRQPG